MVILSGGVQFGRAAKCLKHMAAFLFLPKEIS